MKILFQELTLAACLGCLLALATGCSTTRSTQRALVGKWQTSPPFPDKQEWASRVSTFEFLPNGTYSRGWPEIPAMKNQILKQNGTYTLASKNLLILTPEKGYHHAVHFYLADRTFHTISSEDGLITTYRRVGN
jgi:hypothetical protein